MPTGEHDPDTSLRAGRVYGRRVGDKYEWRRLIARISPLNSQDRWGPVLAVTNVGEDCPRFLWGVDDDIVCPLCDGLGLIIGVFCSQCGGSGNRLLITRIVSVPRRATKGIGSFFRHLLGR